MFKKKNEIPKPNSNLSNIGLSDAGLAGMSSVHSQVSVRNQASQLASASRAATNSTENVAYQRPQGMMSSEGALAMGGRSAIADARKKMDEAIAKETPEQRKAREKKIRNRNMGYPEYPGS